MFRRDRSLTALRADAQHRPLTGSEMEDAADRETWLKRIKAIERVGSVLVAAGFVAAEVFHPDKSLKYALDFVIVALAVLSFTARRMKSRRSQPY